MKIQTQYKDLKIQRKHWGAGSGVLSPSCHTNIMLCIFFHLSTEVILILSAQDYRLGCCVAVDMKHMLSVIMKFPQANQTVQMMNKHDAYLHSVAFIGDRSRLGVLNVKYDQNCDQLFYFAIINIYINKSCT